MKNYTPEDLNRIAMEIARQPGLYLPLPQGAAAPPRTPGPTVCVYLKYSEIVPDAKNIQGLYWNALRQTLVMAAVGMLATIDSLLSERRSADPDTNKMLQERFMTPDLAAKVAAKVVGGPWSADPRSIQSPSPQS